MVTILDYWSAGADPPLRRPLPRALVGPGPGLACGCWKARRTIGGGGWKPGGKIAADPEMEVVAAMAVGHP